jgi:hypothetical protein
VHLPSVSTLFKYYKSQVLEIQYHLPFSYLGFFVFFTKRSRLSIRQTTKGSRNEVARKDATEIIKGKTANT